MVDKEQNRLLRREVTLWLMMIGKTQKWMAEQVDISPSLMTQWIHGKTNINKVTLDKMDKVLEEYPFPRITLLIEAAEMLDIYNAFNK